GVPVAARGRRHCRQHVLDGLRQDRPRLELAATGASQIPARRRETPSRRVQNVPMAEMREAKMWTRIKQEPALLLGVVVAAVALAVSFGVPISEDQSAA